MQGRPYGGKEAFRGWCKLQQGGSTGRGRGDQALRATRGEKGGRSHGRDGGGEGSGFHGAGVLQGEVHHGEAVGLSRQVGGPVLLPGRFHLRLSD